MTEPSVPTLDEIQQEIQEIAEVLLREHPPGTLIADVWDEALTLYRVRFETEVLPAR
jgi:hypothetical protein